MRVLLVVIALSLGLGPLGAAPVLSLIEAEILVAEGAALPEGARLELHLPSSAPQSARRVISQQHDLRKTQFVALVETETGAEVALRGRVFAVIDMPVPRQAITPGALLRAEDFELRSFPLSALGRFSVTDIAALEGAEVRRLLPQGRIVQRQSLQEPRAVRRGERLVLTLENGPLQLTAPARALEDAAIGASVRVQNLNSNKIVMALVLGEGLVQVLQ